MPDPVSLVRSAFDEHVTLALRSRDELARVIAELAGDLVTALATGGKLLVFGNGGSAADAQHLAGELVGRFGTQRRSLPAIALTTDSSVITAIANDFDYGEVFARQVEALGRKGDLVLGISTSGGAESVVRGLRAAERKGARTWALTGGDGGRVREVAARSIVIPSRSTPRIQEMHGTIVHVLAALVDEWAGSEATPGEAKPG